MKKVAVVIIDKNPTTNELLKQHIEENKKITQINQFIDMKEGYDFICAEKPNIIFLDIAYGEEAVFNLADKIFKDDCDCKIAFTGNHFSATSIIKAMKTGAKETLLKPFIKKDVDLLLNKLVNQVLFEDDTLDSKVISVFSTKGGIGKTTIATNLAVELANISKEKTVIVDFNSKFGDVGTFLNIESEFGISYLIKNKDKINREFLLSNLPRYKKSNLYVLSDLFSIDESEEIDLMNIQDILDALKTTFKYIIVDMDNSLDLKATKIFDNSDNILFPIVANMPNLRNCQRLLNFLQKMQYEDDSVKIILNRYVKQDEIKTGSIEEILKKSIFSKLSNDYFNNMAAINRGISVNEVDSTSPFAKDISDLAYKILEKGV